MDDSRQRCSGMLAFFLFVDALAFLRVYPSHTLSDAGGRRSFTCVYPFCLCTSILRRSPSTSWDGVSPDRMVPVALSLSVGGGRGRKRGKRVGRRMSAAIKNRPMRAHPRCVPFFWRRARRMAEGACGGPDLQLPPSRCAADRPRSLLLTTRRRPDMRGEMVRCRRRDTSRCHVCRRLHDA